MIQSVVFDLDDTMISELEYVKTGFRHVARVLGKVANKPADDIEDLMNSLFRSSTDKVFNRTLHSLGMPASQALVDELVDEYRGHTPELEFYPDVLPCLRRLKSAGMKVGIITDGYAVAQRQKLLAVNAYEHFDEIIITDE